MRDPLDDTLAEAGRLVQGDDDLGRALSVLVKARAADAAAKPRRSRKLAPVIAIGVALAVASGGAVAATQWTNLFEPDIVIERDWSDADGTHLGSCETHLRVGSLPAETREALRIFLGSLDVDSIKPDPDVIAAELDVKAVLEKLQQRLAEAEAEETLTRIDREVAPQEQFADARILQDGLVHAIATRIAAELEAQHPELDRQGVATLIRTECTTPPNGTVDK